MLEIGAFNQHSQYLGVDLTEGTQIDGTVSTTPPLCVVSEDFLDTCACVKSHQCIILLKCWNYYTYRGESVKGFEFSSFKMQEK